MNNTNTIEKLLLGATEEQLQSLIEAKRTIRAIEQQVRFPHVRRSQHDGDGHDGNHRMAPEVRARIAATMKRRWKERKNGGKTVVKAKKSPATSEKS